MSSELLIDLVEKLDYIRELTLCGMKAVDDDSLEKVSMELLKKTCWCFLTILGGTFIFLMPVTKFFLAPQTVPLRNMLNLDNVYAVV